MVRVVESVSNRPSGESFLFAGTRGAFGADDPCFGVADANAGGRFQSEANHDSSVFLLFVFRRNPSTRFLHILGRGYANPLAISVWNRERVDHRSDRHRHCQPSFQIQQEANCDFLRFPGRR